VYRITTLEIGSGVASRRVVQIFVGGR